ncbi:hypothetical protein ACQJBY_061644 [Aegilops geniculata]
MLGGMPPKRWLCERSSRVRVVNAERLSGSSGPLNRLPRRVMPLITGWRRRHCTVQLMPRQWQGAEVFSQDSRACWLGLSRLAFQARSALACPSSTGASPGATDVAMTIIVIISMVMAREASVLDGTVSIAC